MNEMSVASVVVGDRFRKDMGDLDALAQSIVANGLLQPIVVDGQRNLVCGARRLAAVKLLGWEVVPIKKFDCGNALTAEHDENVMRKAFTKSEQVAIADAIAEKLAGRAGRPGNSGNISLIDSGQTRDIAAKKAGLGSGKTYEAAKQVVKNGSQKLVDAMDAGLVSISRAAHISKLPLTAQESVDFQDKTKVELAADNVVRRERQAAARAEMFETPVANPDMGRLYEEGSSISAYVLAHRANTAIAQIGRADPNAIAAIESIRAVLDKQMQAITREQ